MKSLRIILPILLMLLPACGLLPGGEAEPTPTLIPFTPGVGLATAGPSPTPTEVVEDPTATAVVEEAVPTATPLPTATPTDVPAEEPAPTDEPPPFASPTPIAPQASTTDPVEIVASGGTAAALDTAWLQAYELPAGVPFEVTFTEAEIEAKIAMGMAASGYGSNVSGYDVSLNNGQIGVTFAYKLPAPATRTVSAQVVFAVSLDGNGNVVVQVVSAQVTGQVIGTVQLPPELVSALNAVVAQAISGGYVEGQTGADVTFTQITINGGAMTLAGYVTP